MDSLVHTESDFIPSDVENSTDAAPETPLTRCVDIDLDQHSNQGVDDQACSVGTGTPNRRDSRIKPETMLARVGSFTSITGPVNLESIFEYEWADSDSEVPSEKLKESYVVQEILADYLQVKSFKRKYPDLSRRTMDAYERSWLQQEGLVPPGRADLGLTALRTDEVMKLLQQDYPDVHNALSDLFRHRRFQQAADLQKRQYEAARIERGEARAEAARRRALDSAADFNHRLITERLTNRRCYWDLQTMQIHLPQRVYKLLESRPHSKGAYPVAVIPGQFAEHYEVYTPEQLMQLPLSRCLYAQPSRKHREPPPLPTDLRFGSLQPPLPTIPETAAKIAFDESVTDGPEVCIRVSTKDCKAETGHGPKSPVSSNRIIEADTASAIPNGVRSATKAGGKSADSDVVQCMVCRQDAEVYLKCAECGHTGHLKCLEISEEMLSSVKSYEWLCMECKRCVECSDSGHEEQMMFCDLCDRGYHAFCVGLKRIPHGRWECPLCTGKPSTVVKKRTRTPKTPRSRSSSASVRQPRKPRKRFSDASHITDTPREAKPKRKPRRSKKSIAQDAVLAATPLHTPDTATSTGEKCQPSSPLAPVPERRKRGRPRLSDKNLASPTRLKRPRQRKNTKPRVSRGVSDVKPAEILSSDHHSAGEQTTADVAECSTECNPPSSPVSAPVACDVVEGDSGTETPTTEEGFTTITSVSTSQENSELTTVTENVSSCAN